MLRGCVCVLDYLIQELKKKGPHCCFYNVINSGVGGGANWHWGFNYPAVLVTAPVPFFTKSLIWLCMEVIPETRRTLLHFIANTDLIICCLLLPQVSLIALLVEPTLTVGW